MNCDTWSYIIANCDLKDIKNIASINKKFDEIIKLKKFYYFLPSIKKSILFLNACKHKKINNVIFLLKFKDLYISYINKSIQQACENCNNKIVEILLKDTRIDPSYVKSLGILHPIWSQNKKTLELMLYDGRFNLSYHYMEILYRACRSNDINMVEFLLKKDILYFNIFFNINSLCEYGYDKILKLILNKFKINTIKNRFSIITACSHGHIEIVKLLLQDGQIDPSYMDNNAIEWAAEYKHINIIELLLLDRRIYPISKKLKYFIETRLGFSIDNYLIY